MAQHGTLYEWFAASVARNPDQTAVEAGGIALTYRELRDCAHAVAERILSASGEPRRVARCWPRPGPVLRFTDEEVAGTRERAAAV